MRPPQIIHHTRRILFRRCFSSSNAMDPTALLSQPRLKAQPRQIYSYNAAEEKWIASDPSPSELGMPLSTELKIATWNIDFMRANHEERYKTAFDYLEETLSSSDDFTNTCPTITLIQEIEDEFFPIIINHPFVRECYDVTDISGETWANAYSNYGTMTLIPKSLSSYVAAVFRTRFPRSRMQRDALFVDLLLQSREPTSEERDNATQGENQPEKRYLRIANVHLESLRQESDNERPRQLGSVVPFLVDGNVYAGIVAGDMNPIGPYDAALPTQLGLVDAWSTTYRRKKEAEELSSVTEEEVNNDVEGHTWGYQPISRRFAPVRMDKILMRGNVDVVGIERIGVGLKVNGFGTDERPVWASDHYGLLGHFRLAHGDELS